MAEEIRRLDASVPIVVTTAFEQIDYLHRSIEAGVDKYVTKPVDIDKLERALLSCARRLRAEGLLESERQRELARLRAHEREAVGLLAGGMAHDFNNLLQAILSSLDLSLPLVTPGSELSELLELAFDAAKEAAALGQRLVTLSQSWPTSLRAAPVCPSLRAALAKGLAGCGTTLRLDLPADLPDVSHDGELLGRAFEQLAVNAREAMGSGGLLKVSGAVRQLAAGELQDLPAGRYVALTFRDTGPGIPEALLPKVFDPYFSTKPRGIVRGMGLGLALCQAVLRRHHGLVTASSPPGEGAALTVLLPAAT
jgi:signal transduction histidine kinase